MELHQFLHALSYGDAISDEALLIQRLLRKNGVSSEIYAVYTHEKFKGKTRRSIHFEQDLELARANSQDVGVLLHYSIACPLNKVFLTVNGIGRALVYHNLTPVEWYSRYNPRVAQNLVVGRKELPEMLKNVDMALADSAFNLSELEEMGYQGGSVLHLGLDREKWSVDSNPGIAQALRGHGGKNFLHVGRLAPNKCIEDIIKVFYFYHHKINQHSKLWLVGSSTDNELYEFELRRLVNELRLTEAVEFVGQVANSELKSLFENSDLYFCMSEHEGFCVPLIEAMHFGIPPIVFNAGAVGETLGGAGMLVNHKDFALIAELAHLILTDQTLRAEVIARGKARLLAYSEESFERKLIENLIEPMRIKLAHLRAERLGGPGEFATSPRLSHAVGE